MGAVIAQGIGLRKQGHMGVNLASTANGAFKRI
jgi:hypothetical protein